MRATARLWAATLVVGLALSIAHALGLSDAIFAPARALCSGVIALAAIFCIPRHPRMTLVAGLFAAVAWLDVTLLAVDLGRRTAEASDLLLSFVALFATITGYLVLATTQVPSDRRGAWAAMAWLLFGGASIGVFFGAPRALPRVALVLSVALTVRLLLGIQLYEPGRDDGDAAHGLRWYRRGLVIHVLLACGVWPLILVLGLPDALALLLLIPYAAMIHGAARYASASPNRFASIGATATVLVPILAMASMLDMLEPWHARVAALVGFVGLALSFVRQQPALGLASALGFVLLPVLFRYAEGSLVWGAAFAAVVLVAFFVHVVARVQRELES